MSQDADELFAGLTGKVLTAALGVAAPATPAAAWPAEWQDLGFTSDDGVSIEPGMDVEEERAWQMLYPVRILVSGRTLDVSFAMKQWNRHTIPFYFGGGTVTDVPGPPVSYRYDPPNDRSITERQLGIEFVDGDKVGRLIVPRGYVADRDAFEMAGAKNADLPQTFSALGSPGVLPFYILTNDPNWAAA